MKSIPKILSKMIAKGDECFERRKQKLYKFFRTSVQNDRKRVNDTHFIYIKYWKPLIQN